MHRFYEQGVPELPAPESQRFLRLCQRVSWSFAQIVLLMSLLMAFSGVTFAGSGWTGVHAGDPVAGKVKAGNELCQECHGENGLSHSPSIPKLAGQYERYIVKQIRDFQSKARIHQTMSILAESIADDDLNDIAAFFASLPPMRGLGEKAIERSRTLYFMGDPARAVPACVDCHGADGQGGALGQLWIPRIGGQHHVYLRGQLKNWKVGDRKNDTSGVMERIARILADEEVDELAEYISSLGGSKMQPAE